jgi:cell division protein FtsQ
MLMKRHTLYSLLFVVGTLIMVAYVVTILCFTSKAGSERKCEGVEITVNDTSRLRFVTPREIARDIFPLIKGAKGKLLADIDMDKIERTLCGIDKIERAVVTVGTDNVVHIAVDPMEPLARVFDSHGSSYYINKDGKRISANARYFVDVPVVQGDFVDSVFGARELLPLLDYIQNDSLWNRMITMVKVDSPKDVILVPNIRGQVINFGEPDNFESKFARLKVMYTEVLPERGWNFYDTLSVKWRGQVVGTRRHKELPQQVVSDNIDEEEVDVGTMLAAEGVAPGRVALGEKANNEKLIPAAYKEKADTTKQKNQKQN